jgi:ABC-type phosphate transport system substrate-binding protein
MVLGSGKPGWYRRQSVRAKALMGVGTALGVLGMGMLTAGPASADPGNTYLAVGSNTTQNIMDAFATTTGGLVGSYDAVDPVTGTTLDTVNAFQNSGTSQTLQSFLRPNGSGDGFTALRYSNATDLAALTPYDGGTTAEMPAKGAIAFSRSSGSPTSVAGASALSQTGQYVWIPFAYDDVAVSTGASTVITTAGDFTTTDLTNLYKNCQEVSEGGITYWPFETGATQPANTTRIDLYVPQSGSGSRNFWLDTFTGQHSSLPACVFDTQQNSASSDFGKSLEENNGLAVADDPNGIFPYSVGQWLFQKSQSGTPADLRDGATLNTVNGSTTAISPFGNPPTDTTMNTQTFPINRELYNVLITSEVTGSSADPNLVKLFVGTSSLLCTNGGIIRSFGFVPLSASTPLATDQCGSIATSLRADTNG